MDVTDRDEALRTFMDRHHLVESELSKRSEEWVLVLLEAQAAVDRAVAQHVQRLQEEKEPTWALLWTMLDRVGEQAQGSIITYITGAWASSEVVVRVAIESAANFIYIVQEDHVNRLGAYLTDYFNSSEKRQLDHRKVLEAGLPDTASDLQQMDDAKWHLDERRAAITALCNDAGIPFPAPGPKMNIFQRFAKIGEERAYRSIYTVLSSQTHSDAESLVDYVIVKCLADNETKLRIASAEVDAWLTHYVSSAIDWYLRACQQFGTTLMLDGLADVINDLRDDLSNFTQGRLNEFQQQFGVPSLGNAAENNG